LEHTSVHGVDLNFNLEPKVNGSMGDRIWRFQMNDRCSPWNANIIRWLLVIKDWSPFFKSFIQASVSDASLFCLIAVSNGLMTDCLITDDFRAGITNSLTDRLITDDSSLRCFVIWAFVISVADRYHWKNSLFWILLSLQLELLRLLLLHWQDATFCLQCRTLQSLTFGGHFWQIDRCWWIFVRMCLVIFQEHRFFLWCCSSCQHVAAPCGKWPLVET